MYRRLRLVGPMLTGILAVGALSASAASATTTDKVFVTEAGSNVFLTATGNAVFGVKTGALEIHCSEEKFSGSANNEGTSVEVTPTYGGCGAEPFGAATVDVNGCKYRLTATTTTVNNTSGLSPVYEAPVDLICEKGKSIQVTAPGCTLSMAGSGDGRNQNIHGLRFDNEGTGSTEDVKVTVTLDGIHYTSPGGFICSLGGVATTGNDTFITGNWTVKGYTTASHTTHTGFGVTDK